MSITNPTAAAALVALALTIGPAFAQNATTLAIEIQERISADPVFAQVVAVPEGESVVLTGAVASEEEKAMLEAMIAEVEGAGDVDNQVAVR